MIRALVTDIEGTTSSISFVKDVLFPYARQQLPAFVASRGGEPEVRALLVDVCKIVGQDLPDEEVVAQLQCWIDEDRKLMPLKALQGLIWETGYARHDFFGHIYPDAVAGLSAWKEQGLDLYVYSSGSVQAQKLLFEHTEFGDLTSLFSGYFDTRVGAKQDAGSYRVIANHIGVSASEILFLSDVEKELSAACEAGMLVTQVVRPGTEGSNQYPNAATFSEVVLTS